ncbi:MAG: glycosyltransferase [Planctomycetes bacterium]|nr:glycosyltransferase [Planctomycetota bacterium]
MNTENIPTDSSPSPDPGRRVIVVLPAYNEEENLSPLLEGVARAMADDGFAYEVVVVDDGSSDRSIEVTQSHAQRMPVRVERHEVNQGLGATIRDGLRTATEMSRPGDVIVALDADNTHPPGLIGSMVRKVREGNDVVIASRYRYGARVMGVPWHRRMLSNGARTLFQLVFPVPGVRDYTCGYRAYRAGLLKEAFTRYGDDFVSEAGFHCMVDILLKLHKMGSIISEVPLVLRYDQKGGVSKMNVGRTVLQTLGLMLRRRFGR